MATEHGEKGILEAFSNSIRNNADGSSSSSSNCSGFKFNAHAPEFVPRSQTPPTPPSPSLSPSPIPISGYFVPCFQYLSGTNATNGGAHDWIYVTGDPQDSISLVTATNSNPPPALPHPTKTILTEDLQKKILKQVFLSFLPFFLRPTPCMQLFVYIYIYKDRC